MPVIESISNAVIALEMLQLVKERQFSKYEDWRFIIKGSKNHDIGSKIGSIPLPNSYLAERISNLFSVHLPLEI